VRGVITADQIHQASGNRFTKDYYRIMAIVYRAIKQPNAMARMTGFIILKGSNATTPT
jgi:hypothetical protein